MAFVPSPLAEIVRLKVISGAAQMTAQMSKGNSGNGGVETQAIVMAFWMGTPETSRDPVRHGLEQMGLWQYIAAAGAL
jgi:hypothetical protein